MYIKMTVRDLTVCLWLPRTCDDEGRQRASDEAAGSLPGAQRHWWETREESTSSTVPRGVRETKQGYLSSLGVFLLILIIQWCRDRGHWWANEDGRWPGPSPLNKCRCRASPGLGTKLSLFAIWKSSVKNESRVCSSPTWVSLLASSLFTPSGSSPPPHPQPTRLACYKPHFNTFCWSVVSF